MKPAKTAIIGFVKKHPILTAAILFLAYFLCFNLLESFGDRTFILIDTPIDHLIPFSRFASVPYLFWHLEIPAIVFAHFFMKDMEGYWKQVTKLLIGLFLILIFCAIVPTELNMRPAVVEGNDIFAVLTRFVYTMDNAKNVMPSGHAFGALIMFLGWCRHCTRPWQFILNAFVNGAIIISTLFLKQHSILDIVGGLILAAIVECVVEIPTFKQMLAQKKAALKPSKKLVPGKVSNRE